MTSKMKDTLKERRESTRNAKKQDTSSWVQHNQPITGTQEVHFVLPPAINNGNISESEDDELEESPQYKDGGYGWVIAFLSFLLHFILDGVSFSIGVVFVAVQQHFKADRTGASSFASLFLAFPLLLAPLAGTVIDAIGCRKSVFVGASICFVSSIIGLFCTNIWTYAIVFGGGCGLGMSFLYNVAIVMPTYWFLEKRGGATAFSVVGTGLGTVFFPFIFKFYSQLIMSQTEWTLMTVYQTIFINFFAIVLLIGLGVKDIKWESDTEAYKLKKFERDARRFIEEEEAGAVSKEWPWRRSNSLPIFSTFINWHSTSIQSVKEAADMADKPSRSKSASAINPRAPKPPKQPEYTMLNAKFDADEINLDHLDLETSYSPNTTVKQTRRRVLSKMSMSVDIINELDDDELKVNFISPSISADTLPTTKSSSDDSEISNDGDSSSSELTDRQARDADTDLLHPETNTAANARASSSVPTSSRVARPSVATFQAYPSRVLASNAIHRSNLRETGKILSAPMLDTPKDKNELIRMLHRARQCTYPAKKEIENYQQISQKKSSIYFFASVFCLYLILDVPYVYLVDYAMESSENFEENRENAYLITVCIGITVAIGTILYGHLSDLEFFKNRPKLIFVFYGVAMGIVSSTLFLASIATTIGELFFLSSIFGGFVASNYVLQSILLTNNIETINLFQSAYSLISFIEGVASFIGPFIIGFLRDISGTYTAVFYYAGVVGLLSMAFAFLSGMHLEVGSARDSASENMNRRASNRSVSFAPENGTNCIEMDPLV